MTQSPTKPASKPHYPCQCCKAEEAARYDEDIGHCCVACHGFLRAAGAWLRAAGIRCCVHMGWRQNFPK